MFWALHWPEHVILSPSFQAFRLIMHWDILCVSWHLGWLQQFSVVFFFIIYLSIPLDFREISQIPQDLILKFRMNSENYSLEVPELYIYRVKCWTIIFLIVVSILANTTEYVLRFSPFVGRFSIYCLLVYNYIVFISEFF